jgi:hypothetical protein
MSLDIFHSKELQFIDWCEKNFIYPLYDFRDVHIQRIMNYIVENIFLTNYTVWKYTLKYMCSSSYIDVRVEK